MQQGPELLLSGRLREVLDRLRARFDVIIVDSAPLAAGADPLALGTATGRLLLVLRVGATDLHLTTAKLAALTTMPITLVGAVLNDVRSLNGYREYTYGLSGYELPRDDPQDWESDASSHRLEARL